MKCFRVFHVTLFRLLVMAVLLGFPRSLSAEKAYESSCVSSGLLFDDDVVYFPKNCRARTCSATGPTEGFQCYIQNYKDNFPNACARIMDNLDLRPWEPLPHYSEICQPLLSSITLYDFHCKEVNIKEVALNFSYHLPVCDSKSAAHLEAVMVRFTASRKTNYFYSNPVCRVFNCSGSNFSHRSDYTERINISNECMGIGLQDQYPEVYYYLTLTAFPSGAELKYTILYKDVANDSMQLVAGAWLSRTRAHFVFQPIPGIDSYRIEAKSGQHWGFFKNVSIPSVQIPNIPNSSNTVMVTVTPNDRDACERFGFHCSEISISLLDKSNLNLPTEALDPPPQEADNWKEILVIVAGSLIAVVLIAATSIVCRHFVKGRQRALSGHLAEQQPLQQKQALPRAFCITCAAANVCQHVEDLLKEVYEVDVSRETAVSVMKAYDIILIVIHPSVFNSPSWLVMREQMENLFTFKPLWSNVRIIIFAGDNGEHMELPNIFPDSFRERLHGEAFLKFMAKRTYHLPNDNTKLVEELNQEFERRSASVPASRASSMITMLSLEQTDTVSTIQESASAGTLYTAVSFQYLLRREKEEEPWERRENCNGDEDHTSDEEISEQLNVHQSEPPTEGREETYRKQPAEGGSEETTRKQSKGQGSEKTTRKELEEQPSEAVIRRQLVEVGPGETTRKHLMEQDFEGTTEKQTVEQDLEETGQKQMVEQDPKETIVEQDPKETGRKQIVEQDPKETGRKQIVEQDPEETGRKQIVEQDLEQTGRKQIVEQDPEETGRKQIVEQDPEETGRKQIVEQDLEQTGRKQIVEQDLEQTGRKQIVEQDPEETGRKQIVEQDLEQTGRKQIVEQNLEQTGRKQIVEQDPEETGRKQPLEQDSEKAAMKLSAGQRLESDNARETFVSRNTFVDEDDDTEEEEATHAHSWLLEESRGISPQNSRHSPEFSDNIANSTGLDVSMEVQMGSGYSPQRADEPEQAFDENTQQLGSWNIQQQSRAQLREPKGQVEKAEGSREGEERQKPLKTRSHMPSPWRGSDNSTRRTLDEDPIFEHDLHNDVRKQNSGSQHDKMHEVRARPGQKHVAKPLEFADSGLGDSEAGWTNPQNRQRDGKERSVKNNTTNQNRSVCGPEGYFQPSSCIREERELPGILQGRGAGAAAAESESAHYHGEVNIRGEREFRLDPEQRPVALVQPFLWDAGAINAPRAQVVNGPPLPPPIAYEHPFPAVNNRPPADAIDGQPPPVRGPPVLPDEHPLPWDADAINAPGARAVNGPPRPLPIVHEYRFPAAANVNNRPPVHAIDGPAPRVRGPPELPNAWPLPQDADAINAQGAQAVNGPPRPPPIAHEYRFPAAANVNNRPPAHAIDGPIPRVRGPPELPNAWPLPQDADAINAQGAQAVNGPPRPPPIAHEYRFPAAANVNNRPPAHAIDGPIPRVCGPPELLNAQPHPRDAAVNGRQLARPPQGVVALPRNRVPEENVWHPHYDDSGHFSMNSDQ